MDRWSIFQASGQRKKWTAEHLYGIKIKGQNLNDEKIYVGHPETAPKIYLGHMWQMINFVNW